jgi:hypothetical protein
VGISVATKTAKKLTSIGLNYDCPKNSFLRNEEIAHERKFLTDYRPCF